MNKLFIGLFAIFIVTSILLISGCTNNNLMVKDIMQKNTSAGDTMINLTNNELEEKNGSMMSTNTAMNNTINNQDYMPRTAEELKKY